jgi:hypothetical protein
MVETDNYCKVVRLGGGAWMSYEAARKAALVSLKRERDKVLGLAEVLGEAIKAIEMPKTETSKSKEPSC